jgi:hypothetical protein
MFGPGGFDQRKQLGIEHCREAVEPLGSPAPDQREPG